MTPLLNVQPTQMKADIVRNPRLGAYSPHLLGRLGLEPREVPASNVVFVRPGTEVQLNNAQPDQPLSAIATSLGKCRKRITRLLHLSWMAPDVVRAIAEGSQPPSLTAKLLMATDLPILWDDQKAALGFH